MLSTVASVDVEIDGGDIGSACVGCDDVSGVTAAAADVECLVACGTSVGIDGREIDLVTDLKSVIRSGAVIELSCSA